jgi:thiol-disulfide isomerase/thioredoxin
MNKLPLTLLLIIACYTTALSQATLQKTCTIKGELGSIAPYVKKVFVQYRDGANFARGLMDSSEVTNGSYMFRLQFKEPLVAYFQVRMDKPKMQQDNIPLPSPDENVFEYFLDAGNISIRTDSFPFGKSIAKGSLADKQYRQLNQLLKPLDNNIQQWQDSLKIADKAKSPDTSRIGVISQKINELIKKKFIVYLKFLNDKKSHINAHILQYALNLSKRAPLDIVRYFYTNIHASVKQEQAKYAKMFSDFIDFVPGIDAPVFARKNSHNQMTRLRDYEGKYVLLDFWGSWCKPCREKHPELVNIYNKYKTKNFEIIGIAKDGDEGLTVSKETAIQTWLNAIQKDELPWVNVLYKGDDRGQPGLDELYRVISYPSNFLIDPNGKIIMINIADKDLDSLLGSLLK